MILNDRIRLEISTLNKYHDFIIPRSSNTAALDFDKLVFPLKIRRWEQGDSFFPLGMNRRKKISDFLIDVKVNRIDKQDIFVLLSGNQIVWLIGKRIDNRYKVSEKTNKILMIKIR